MDFSMFLVFPGILITIGVGLLLLSIIIVIIAYKTADKPESSNLNQIDYNKTIENENNESFNSNIYGSTSENINNNKPEEKPNENMENNPFSEEKTPENIDNNVETNLEQTKIFSFPDNSALKEELPKVEIPKKLENEEKMDAFEQEFEKAEDKKIEMFQQQEIPKQEIMEEKVDVFKQEFESPKEEKQIEVYPKIKDIKTEKPVINSIKQPKIEEEEEEIEIL
ncbi:MAG: hypothetical protein ACI31R_06100 [Bacilli bacterium]